MLSVKDAETCGELAAKLGTSYDEVTKLVDEHGTDVIKTLQDALHNGLTSATILEILNLGGKVVVEILSDIGATKKLALATPQIIEGVEVTGFSADNSVLNTILQQIMPMIIKTYLTPDNVQKLINLILSALTPPVPTPAK